MHYPPRSLRAALALSRSAAVEALWQRAEHLPEGGGVGGGEGGGVGGGEGGGEGGGVDGGVRGGPFARLPDWAVPMPNA